MPVTNYYSVNGKIVGQKVVGQPASARVDYLTDALGNVVATADQRGAVQNRYAYKPYGSLLAKGGIAPDPAFTWVGSYAYRQTSKKYSDTYIRARHYTTASGRWTTTDPLMNEPNLYTYVNANVTTLNDPTGLKPAIHCPDCRAITCSPPCVEGAATFNAIYDNSYEHDCNHPMTHCELCCLLTRLKDSVCAITAQKCQNCVHPGEPGKGSETHRLKYCQDGIMQASQSGSCAALCEAVHPFRHSEPPRRDYSSKDCAKIDCKSKPKDNPGGPIGYRYDCLWHYCCSSRFNTIRPGL